MENVSTFTDAANGEIKWNNLMDHPEWRKMPDSWESWKHIIPRESIAREEDVLLFRTHQQHTNPDLRKQTEGPLIHAAPAPVIPGQFHISRYDAREIYGGTERFSFITVYKARPNQRFFKDEEVEYARQTGNEGIAIEEIESFDPKTSHFETDATDCEIRGTYMLLLPDDPSCLSKPRAVDTDAIRVLRIDDKPQIIEALNSKLDFIEDGEDNNLQIQP